MEVFLDMMHRVNVHFMQTKGQMTMVMEDFTGQS